MNQCAGTSATPEPLPMDALFPAVRPVWRERFLTIAGVVLSFAVLIAAFRQVGGFDRKILAQAPSNPWFWLCFFALYSVGPLMEWLILRRIWGIGVGALPALLRKQVANEIVFGYSGDAQFYLWARRQLGLRESAFATLRDVTILSALAGNLATLLMMIASAPLLYSLADGTLLDAFSASTGVIVVSSLLIFAMRRTFVLFTLPPRDLLITFGLHCLRIAIGLLATGLLWSLLLPGLPATTLIAVATLRMMVHRLPLLPSRDALLAPLILALLGAASGLAAATMLVAALSLVAHLLVGTATSLGLLAVRPPARA